LAGLLVLSKYGLTVNAVAKTYLIASLIVCVPLMVFGAWLIKPILWRGTKALIQRFIVDLGQLFITNWLYLLHCGLDLYLLQLLMSSVEVGLYSAALKLVIALGMLPFLFLMSVTPEMTRRTFVSDFIFVRRFWVDATRMFALSAGGLVVFILIMADYIIHLAYGSTYEPATIVLRILSISLIPRFLQTVIQSLLFAAGRYKDLIRGFAVGLLVQAIGGLILISYFGPEGAAVAFLMAECATLVSFSVFANRAFGRPSLLVIGKVFIWLVATVSVTFFGLQLKLPVTLLLSSVTIFCLLLSYYLGCISLRDIQLGKSMWVEFLQGKA
jgi:O-antigen/teichoic acid export membrane protein